MSDDVPDLPGNPFDGVRVAEEEEPEAPGDRKLYFRAWLWLQLNTRTKYSDLAKMVLSGGPDSVWLNKPIYPESVLKDIEQFYATGRDGVNADLLEQARSAVKAYRENPESVQKLTEARQNDKLTRKRMADQITRVFENVLSDGEQTGGVVAKGDEPADAGRPLVVINPRDATLPGTMIPKTARCRHTGTIAGKAWQCTRAPILGYELCELHGGQFVDPEEIKNIIQVGQQRLIMASEVAISTVIDVMENGVNEATRLKAAEMVLDRTGFRTGIDISIGGGGQEAASAAETLRERLSNLGEHGKPKNDVPIQGEIVLDHMPVFPTDE